jgi:hypothetical protein
MWRYVPVLSRRTSTRSSFRIPYVMMMMMWSWRTIFFVLFCSHLVGRLVIKFVMTSSTHIICLFFLVCLFVQLISSAFSGSLDSGTGGGGLLAHTSGLVSSPGVERRHSQSWNRGTTSNVPQKHLGQHREIGAWFFLLLAKLELPPRSAGGSCKPVVVVGIDEIFAVCWSTFIASYS